MQGEHAEDAQVSAVDNEQPLTVSDTSKLTVPFYAPGFVMNKNTVKLLNDRYYAKHSNEEEVVHYSKFFFPLDSVDHWNRLYGKRGFTQYQVVFPHESSTEGVIHLLERIVTSQYPSFLSVLKSFGNEGNGLLSFPKRGYTLTVDLPNKPGLRTFIDSLNELTQRYNGRVYLAKDHFLDRHTFEEMYGGKKLDAFHLIKRRSDPENRFTSSLGRRIGLS